jgi:RND family efflux transporter MFP subunit
MSFFRVITLITVCGVGSVLGGCHRPAAQVGGPPPPMVQTAPPESRVVTDWKEGSGRLDAVESVEIRPRVTGHLVEVRFRSGELVKKDDILFVIDPRWQRAAKANAEAQLSMARVTHANAQREWERVSRLEKGRALSTSEIDTQRTRLSESAAAVLGAEAAVNSATLDLEMTEVRSPIDGRVSRPLLTVGNYVSGVAGFTTLLTSVVSVDPVYVYASVDEATYLEFARLKRENRVKLDANGRIPLEAQLDGESGFAHSGWIESFDNRIDATTGSIVVRGVLPNADGSLVPGAFVRVRVPKSLEYSAVLVDEKLIGTDQNQRFVLTLGAKNVVEYRPVKLGDAIDGRRIIREGLAAGDTLIVSNLQLIRPGMPVTPVPAAGAGESPAHAKTVQR